MKTIVTERLQEIFREVLSEPELVLSDELTASDVPAWDSLAHINLMFVIESEFGVQFLDDQLAEFRNVGELLRYLDEYATA